MQLNRDAGDVRGEGSFIFPISVGTRRVPCTVTRDALAAFVSDYDDPRRAFIQSRRMIEQIAREKFVAGAIDPDGGITLSADDVLRLFPD